jgi:RNA polymerase sigma-70 factor, ECF subfamily
LDGDRALMRRIRNQDERAFSLLVARHGGRMLAVATRLLGSRADGEDAVQRAFMRCLTAAGVYRPEWAVSTWLYRILTNVCIDEIRRQRVRDGGGATVPDPSGGPGMRRVGMRRAPRRHAADFGAGGPTFAEDRSGARIDLQRVLLKVPTEARVLLILRHVDGLSYNELARVRGISVNTVKSQLARGKTILKTILKKEGLR